MDKFCRSVCPRDSLLQDTGCACVCSCAVLQARHVCEQGAGPAAGSWRVGALGTLQRLLQVLWRRNPEHQQGLQQARVRHQKTHDVLSWFQLPSFRALSQCSDCRPRNGGRFCVGRRMKFRSCNTEPCPRGRKDFREEQCSQFDGKHFNINGLPPSVRWIPKYIGSE